MALSGILNFFMPVSMMVDANCDYYQNLVVGQEYYIYNDEYLDKYQKATACRWIARSDPGTRIVISCGDIDLPSSTDCTADRLAISLSGDQSFKDSKNFCGKGTVTLLSHSNNLAVGLFAPQRTQGGRFLCTVTSIMDTNVSASLFSSTDECDCGWRETTRIVGGIETKVNEFPAMAGIVDIDRSILFCGGTIISTKYVVTAGHCVWNRTYSSLAVLVGDHNLLTGNDTSYSRLYVVGAYEIHPNYSQDSQTFDIAIIRTTRTMVFSQYVGPICLPFRFTTRDFADEEVTVLGWGALEFLGPTSNVLQKVELEAISNAECNTFYPNTPVIPTQLCTYAEGKDACQGDSGGPVLWIDPSKRRLHLIGVISVGVGCGSTKPGISSRITRFLSWIISRTQDASYCVK